MIQRVCWHRSFIVRDLQTRLGDVIGQLKVVPEWPDDDVIDNDLILVWGSQKRIITGSDLLGRLLRGIATVKARNPAPSDRECYRSRGRFDLVWQTGRGGS
jgi:hypothetical protein